MFAVGFLGKSSFLFFPWAYRYKDFLSHSYITRTLAHFDYSLISQEYYQEQLAHRDMNGCWFDVDPFDQPLSDSSDDSSDDDETSEATDDEPDQFFFIEIPATSS